MTLPTTRADVIAVTASGHATAASVAAATGGRVIDPVLGIAETLRAAFRAGRPIVLVGASGIAIRALAPLIADKAEEPPVLAVAEDGSSVVPLLGGHRGANDLARRIADALGGTAAITTASDVRFGVALDAPPAGWTLVNPARHKEVAAALLAGASARVEGSLPWLDHATFPRAEDGTVTLAATIRRTEDQPGRLVYHPATLALGVGCERGCDPDELWNLVQTTLADADLAPGAIACVVSLDLKSDEAAVHTAAARLGVPARFFDAARLEAEAPRLATPSDVVFREVGCHGVSEGAALAAAGSDAVLVVPKHRSARATCAVAEAPAPIDPTVTGHPRGSLAIVGTGPGTPDWRTPEVDALVAAADDLVGYDLYLDLLGPIAHHKTRHPFPLGAEEDRARAALDLAAAGRKVALVSSGDPGIYAMATLVFELLDRTDRADWGRVAVQVSPGVSALQAAAARIGAPLGHDFCTISLSDLLTPWAAIEGRIKAAAEGDFVVAFYNPVSRRRRTQLHAAKAALSAHRPADTPVVLARSLGRPEETVAVTTLADLDPETVDMLTVVLVGSSTTRAVPRSDGGCWVYTPRGYAGKPGSALLEKDAS
ncbi:precorrin-3B C(17)-methyltransferase [Thalassobaculum sp.]|uniref:precorrin-3B C(17)-methyltransferase n=1 Tax=Thalassobaculum sp. TaxID=2022740 RepID=UPI0032EBA098